MPKGTDVEQSRKTRELDPGFVLPVYPCAAEEQAGRYAEAVDCFLQVEATYGEKQERLDDLRAAFQAEGIKGFWKKEIAQHTKDAARYRGSSRHFAYAHSLLEEKDKPLSILRRWLKSETAF